MLLKVGSIGAQVKELQRSLSLKDDGVFGIDTLKAVKNFQSKNGLISDGIVGNRTWDVLLNTPKIDAQDKQKYSLSDNGMKLLEQFEGLRLEAYLDSASIATIGFGSIRYPNGNKVKLGDKITKAQAKEYKLHDLKEFESTVNTSVKVPLTQNQYDALVSLSYNIGSSAFKNSTLLKKLNNGDYKGAAEQFLVWNKVNSKKVQGLVNRREAERNLFIK
ncbi:MAG: glycoside hydrolase family protein [Cellulosilyticaceae bacterium]